MRQPAEAIAYHGWGFDRSCWSAWKLWFAARQVPLATFDRGYFGEPQHPGFSHAGFKLLLVHSYGLHLCPIEQLSQVDLLIIFNSFIDFHPAEQREQRRSQLVLRQMVRDCQQQPEAVLEAFRVNCGYSPLEDSGSQIRLNQALLVEDLKNLGTAGLALENLKTIPSIVIFHGTADQIVPLDKGIELFEQLHSKAQSFKIEKAGHALPFTHAEQCWTLLDRIFEQNN